MNLGMNTGTKIRTRVAIIALVNQGFAMIGDYDFGNETANLVYRIVSFVFLLGAYVTSHWYNNDFTPEACIGTGVTRQLKAEGRADYIGDYFFDEDCLDEAEEGEEDEQDAL